MIEGANINRSLLALGNCITALSSAVAFVPYRASNLTSMLEVCLDFTRFEGHAHNVCSKFIWPQEAAV